MPRSPGKVPTIFDSVIDAVNEAIRRAVNWEDKYCRTHRMYVFKHEKGYIVATKTYTRIPIAQIGTVGVYENLVSN